MPFVFVFVAVVVLSLFRQPMTREGILFLILALLAGSIYFSFKEKQRGKSLSSVSRKPEE